jgi:hypothetical protein
VDFTPSAADSLLYRPNQVKGSFYWAFLDNVVRYSLALALLAIDFYKVSQFAL